MELRKKFGSVALLCVLAGVILCLAPTKVSLAQTLKSLTPPLATRQLKLIITWRANSLVPPTYIGRIMPGGKSTVTAFLQAFENEKPVSLEGYEIEWRANGIPFLKGENKTEFKFTTRQNGQSVYLISAQAKEGQAIAGSAVAEVSVMDPRLVLSVPYVNKNLPREDVFLQALPYFFNAKSAVDLSFSWKVGGISLAPESILGTLASMSFDGAKQGVLASVKAENRKNPGESASSNAYFNVK
jgi:hypothetical protein